MHPDTWLKVLPAGLYCEPGGFFIDPVRPVPRAIITHAHADHARPGHGAVLASPETIALMDVRMGQGRAGETQQALPYGERIQLDGVTVWLEPAGHVLGSAQIAMEWRGSRAVVSGDYKRAHDPTCLPFIPIPCDVFVTEATFALPVFRHPVAADEIAKLVDSVALFPDRTHVVGAYALGKAQRVIALLRQAGWDRPIYLHGAMLPLCAAYERLGIPLGPVLPATVQAKADLAGAIVIAPPSAIADRWARRLNEPLACLASGWMRVRSRARAKGVELPLVISDHCDWDELLTTLDDVGAPDVWVTHGREEALIHEAAKKGIHGRALRLIGYGDEEEGEEPAAAMIAFAELLERLAFSPGRLAKVALLRRYFATQPDPDRGFGLAALTGELAFQAAKPALIRGLAEQRTDPVLFAWSYDYVGDLAETVALMWPERPTNAPTPTLTDVVQTLLTTPKSDLPGVVATWLDASDASVRYALLKLITGSLRVGASARIAKIALAELANETIAADDIEEVWHGLTPPYTPLFAWLEGHAPRPDPAGAPIFRPPMLAHPLEAPDIAVLDPADYRAEWKWDGIRVQLVATPNGRRLYSRGSEDISAAFPEIIECMTFHAVLDGELLVMRDNQIAPFADLQQRLNRKAPSAKMMRDFPVAVRLYDLLFDGAEDLRPLPFDTRRAHLERWFAQTQPPRMDLSALIPFTTVDELATIRAGTRAASIEGLMLKRGDSAYVPGRPKGQWWKWKRDPLTIDAVVMYAQRGHGKRSSFYSDYTFGLWREDGELVPVGKAYSGFTDAELVMLDRWIRNHTTNRFGPVREVERGLVLEIAFDAAQRSQRHKSGVALRFPRVARLRWDKPVEEADRLESLMRLIP